MDRTAKKNQKMIEEMERYLRTAAEKRIAVDKKIEEAAKRLLKK